MVNRHRSESARRACWGIEGSVAEKRTAMPGYGSPYRRVFLALSVVFSICSSCFNLQWRNQRVDYCEPFAANLPGWSRGCGCRYNATNSVISLYQLQTNSSKAGYPRFEAKGYGSWTFSFNPCKDFSKFQDMNESHGVKVCRNVAGARWTSLSVDECFGLGDQSSATFQSWPLRKPDKLTVSNLTVTFRDKKTTYGMQISLLCNRKIQVNKTVFEYLGQDDKTATYFFKLEGICSCPNGCYKEDDNEISKELWYVIGIGSGILLLLLLIVLVIHITQKKKEQDRLKFEDDLTEPLLS